MNNPNQYLVPIAIVLAIIILVGAYFLFQPNSALPTPPETATSTATSSMPSAATTTGTAPAAPANPLAPAGAGSGTAVVTPGSSSFSVSLGTTSVAIGSALPTITVKIPPGSRNKVLELGLKPASSANGIPEQVLVVVAINTDGTSYPVSGLRFETYVDAKSGNKVNVAPGAYELEAVIWDRNPLTVNGTYGDFSGNNATATLSAPFTITQ